MKLVTEAFPTAFKIGITILIHTSVKLVTSFPHFFLDPVIILIHTSVKLVTE